MNFVRKITDSNILASVIDIPESLRNTTVEILIFPYEDPKKTETNMKNNQKRARGFLTKYRSHDLQKLENQAWEKAAADK